MNPTKFKLVPASSLYWVCIIDTLYRELLGFWKSLHYWFDVLLRTWADGAFS